jgi:hypothetical protein
VHNFFSFLPEILLLMILLPSGLKNDRKAHWLNCDDGIKIASTQTIPSGAAIFPQ